jgi:NAD(P)-dependent dehydrogenase (short-subunit alcohol dehydrogenase family)
VAEEPAAPTAGRRGLPLRERARRIRYADAAFAKALALNVRGVSHLTRFLVPLLEKGVGPGDPARVINIGSVAGPQAPILETYAYSASKAAVHHLTRVLAHWFAPQGITVNARPARSRAG